jgi:hypothetical protein
LALVILLCSVLYFSISESSFSVFCSFLTTFLASVAFFLLTSELVLIEFVLTFCCDKHWVHGLDLLDVADVHTYLIVLTM